MNSKISIIATNSDIIEKMKQASYFSTDPITLDQTNAQMFRNVRLIWLNNSVAGNVKDCQDIINQLRGIVNAVDTFIDVDQCIDFLTDINNEKVLMIISDTLYRITIPLIHDILQLHAIVIFSENETTHEQWTKEWFKVKGIFSHILPICKALKEAAKQCVQNATSISFVNTNGDVSKQNLDELDSSFMYTLILKEILLTIKFEHNHIKQFINYCRVVLADNRTHFNYVDKFEQEYRDKTPIWWYTHEYFLYSMLNRALRLMDVNIVINMGFFISDLHRHIEQLHNEQFGGGHCGKSFAVYRGQGISRVDFNQMAKTKGGLLSFNNFLSTSKDRRVSLLFAESNQSNSDLVGILFVITIDTSKSTTPFASINAVSHFAEEDEILFSMHTVFRICDVKPMDADKRLFQVDLTLTTDNDKDLCVLTERMRKETFPLDPGWYRLGQLLIKIGHFEKAQRVYETLLEQTTDEITKGSIYHQIGWTKDSQGEYTEAIIYYEKSLEIQHQSSPLDYPSLATSYNNIGMVYYNMTDYSKALSFYKKALEIRQNHLPSNHSHLADSYNNIGNVHSQIGEHSEAILFNEKALQIRQQALSPNHPNVATSYANIGNVYSQTGEHWKALLFFKKTLQILKKILPQNHPDLAASYSNIGSIYDRLEKYTNALPYYVKTLKIGETFLSPNHRILQTFYHDIGNIHSELDEHSKALASYEKSLAIQLKVLKSDHRDLATSYGKIGNMHSEMGRHSEALSSYLKALEIYQKKKIPPNDPNLADHYNNIGCSYTEIGKYSQALLYYEKALKIRQSICPPNYSTLGRAYRNIGFIYDIMSEHSKALSSYEKAIEICQKIFPLDYSVLASSYNSIGVVYYNMGKYPEARSFYERAVNIEQRSLQPNHRHLQLYRKNLASVERN